MRLTVQAPDIPPIPTDLLPLTPGRTLRFRGGYVNCGGAAPVPFSGALVISVVTEDEHLALLASLPGCEGSSTEAYSTEEALMELQGGVRLTGTLTWLDVGEERFPLVEEGFAMQVRTTAIGDYLYHVSQRCRCVRLYFTMSRCNRR
jgi:hypothetical protein